MVVARGSRKEPGSVLGRWGRSRGQAFPQPSRRRCCGVRCRVAIWAVAAVDHHDTFVVIAAFNEGKVIRAVVGEVAAAGYSVVVVDDGSRDDTASAARIAGVHV